MSLREAKSMSPAEWEPEEGHSARLWSFVFVVIIAINLFIFASFNMLLPTLSLYLEAGGAGKEDIGRIFSTFTISVVVTRIVTGWLARRFGTVVVIRIGLAICMLSCLGYYYFPGLPGAATARFLHGAGFGLSSTLLTALAAKITPPTRMAEGLGYVGLGATLSLAFGPLVGIWLMEDFGFFVLFMAVSSCYILSISSSLAIPKVEAFNTQPGAPMPKITLFERRVLVPAALALFYGLIICCVSIYLALHCAERKLPYASQFFCVTAFGVLVARFTTGRIYDRYGPNRVILPGILILTLSLLMIYEAETRGLLCCTGFLYGLSSGALFPAFQALTLSFAPGYLRTEATASFYNAFDVGVGCGTLVMGQVAGYFESYSAIYLAGGLIGVALFIYYVSFFVARRRDRA